MTTITQTISTLSTAPTRSDPATFDSRADTFLGELEDLPTELNTLTGQINTVASEVSTNATTAGNAAATATAAANAETWSSYSASLHDMRISPTDHLFYINTTGSGGTTDPSSDATNWNPVSLNEIVGDTTPQLGGHLDCNDNQIVESSYVQVADASLGTGTHTFDYSAGDMQQITATGNITLATTGFISGAVCSMIIDAVNFGAHTITHPAAWLFAAATAPTYTAAGTDRLLLLKDKDDLYTLHVIGQEIGTV